MRRSLVVGNWKMNGSLVQNKDLVGALKQKSFPSDVEVVVCPPTVYLPQVADLVNEDSICVGAQDVSHQANGAYTGDTAAEMLKEFDCQYVIVGHSERRENQSESNTTVAEKCLQALKNSITPIACVGESLEQREQGATLSVISEQIQALIERLSKDQLKNIVIAYEPIWAIGTGLTATPEQAQEVHAAIREQLADAGSSVSLLYGGSVKAANAAELFTQKDIDGALVGGASLDADDFCAIANSF